MVRYRRSRYFENGAANFQKEAKAAALQFRSPPAVEAKAMNLKEGIGEWAQKKLQYELQLFLCLGWLYYFTANEKRSAILVQFTTFQKAAK